MKLLGKEEEAKTEHTETESEQESKRRRAGTRRKEKQERRERKRGGKRLNLQRGSSRASVNFLSSAWLHKNPGLAGVAKAVKIYQDQNWNKIAPKQAFVSTSWLNTMEHM